MPPWDLDLISPMISPGYFQIWYHLLWPTFPLILYNLHLVRTCRFPCVSCFLTLSLLLHFSCFYLPCGSPWFSHGQTENISKLVLCLCLGFNVSQWSAQPSIQSLSLGCNFAWGGSNWEPVVVAIFQGL